jgi:membrane peptidoglycan carboxypeptidase
MDATQFKGEGRATLWQNVQYQGRMFSLGFERIGLKRHIANDGARPQPHSIDSIDEFGQTIYEFPNTPPSISDAADPASFYQLKTILQGVVERGTARAISSLSPYVAGKTGTTEDAVDGWFVGFTSM